MTTQAAVSRPFDITVELLDIELERLERDHYSTPIYEEGIQIEIDCDGCIRAIRVRRERNALLGFQSLTYVFKEDR